MALANMITLNGVELTDDGRTWDENHDPRIVQNELANGSIRRYNKAQKKKFQIAWTWLPNASASTTDRKGGRDAVRAIAYSGASATLLVRNVATGPTSSVTTAVTTNILTLSSNGFTTGQAMQVLTNSTAGLTVGSIYYVITPTTNTFQLSSTLGGSAVALTNGSCTLYPLEVYTTLVESYSEKLLRRDYVSNSYLYDVNLSLMEV